MPEPKQRAQKTADGRDVDLQIRAATPADLEDIVAIELSSFKNPWPRTALAEEIELRSWSQVFVSFNADQLVGFMVHWNVVDEIHLLNLAVSPECRRMGVATFMLEHLLSVGRSRATREIFLEVRASNFAAQALYRKTGFAKIGVRKNYYVDSREDAWVMSLKL